ncbi:MAG: tetratricopeptide repeat protein [Verrucomicrobiota bacterium]
MSADTTKKPLPETDEAHVIPTEYQLWETYKYLILGTAAVLLIAATSYIGWWFYETTQANEARFLLIEARKAEDSEKTDKLKAIISAYPTTSATAQSLLTLASEAQDASDFATAGEYYQTFIDGFPEHPAFAAAEYAYAQCLENQGNEDAAQDLYMRMLNREPVHAFFTAASIRAAAIANKKGDVSTARQLLTEALAMENNPFTSEAQKLLSTIPAPAKLSDEETE